MKYFLSFLFLCALCVPASLVAQAGPVGEWTSSGVNAEGQAFVFKVTIAADNTYTVDFGADGQVEINGTYKVEENTMTIQDNEGSDCTGAGVYKFEVDGENLTMTRISEECEGRGGPEGVMRMTKA